MADEQISQSGPLFPKISPLDAKLFDLARRADFDDEAAVLNSVQDAGVRDENLPVHGFSTPKLDCRQSLPISPRISQSLPISPLARWRLGPASGAQNAWLKPLKQV